MEHPSYRTVRKLLGPDTVTALESQIKAGFSGLDRYDGCRFQYPDDALSVMCKRAACQLPANVAALLVELRVIRGRGWLVGTYITETGSTGNIGEQRHKRS